MTTFYAPTSDNSTVKLSAPPATAVLVPGKQQKTEQNEQHSLSSIRNDHALVRACFDRLQNAAVMEEKVRVFNDMIKLISQHDVAEEVVLYPTIRNLGLGHLADKAINQTIELEQLVYDMDQKYGTRIVDNGLFMLQLQRLRELFNNHTTSFEEDK